MNMTLCEECIFKGMSPREAITTNHHHRVCGYHASPYRLTLVERGGGGGRGGGSRASATPASGSQRLFVSSEHLEILKLPDGSSAARGASSGSSAADRQLFHSPSMPFDEEDEYDDDDDEEDGQYGGGGGQYGQPQQPQVAAQQYGQYGGGGGQYDVIDGFDPAKAFGGAKPVGRCYGCLASMRKNSNRHPCTVDRQNCIRLFQSPNTTHACKFSGCRFCGPKMGPEVLAPQLVEYYVYGPQQLGELQQYGPQQYGQYGGGGGQYGQPQQPQFAQPATLEVRPIRPIRVQSEVIRCIQRPSAGLTGPPWPSVALRGYQRPSKAIRDHQWPSVAISDQQ